MIFRAFVSNLLFCRHSWHLGFYRVKRFLGILVDDAFDESFSRKSCSICSTISIAETMENHAKIMSKVVSDTCWPAFRSWDTFWGGFWSLWGVWGLSLATFVDPGGVPGPPRRRPRTPQERHRDPQERPKTLLETLLGPSWVVWAPQD